MDRDIELRHLRYFIAVAEELHFGRAAQRLHLAQPPLSQQIRKLEDLLGYPLFLRTSRSVALTSAGEAFLQRARALLRTLERDLDETRSIGRGEVGSLHIGFVGSAMLTTLPAIFRAYREAFPGVRLHLHESFTSRVVQGLEDGTLDAGILRDGDQTPTILTNTLFTESFVAVLPATHPRAHQRTLSPADLRDDPFVFYPRTAGTLAYDQPLSIFEAHGFRPHVVQEATHWLTILRLVGAGLGVSVAPACVRQLRSPGIVCLPLRGSTLVSNVEFARLAHETRPIVQGFAHIALKTSQPPTGTPAEPPHPA
jgi:DNA-binding transcriptional LysR family regulator